MASIVGGVAQESSVGWKTNASKGQKKGVLSGRTPLGDLSNSLKPNSVTAAKKKNINAPTSKKQQATTRKALSDISNSGRPNLNEAPKKNTCSKLSVLPEEPIDACEITGEQFLHNHHLCIKAQSKAMDLDIFLQTLGLDNDPLKLESIPFPYQSPPRQFQLKEMAEEFIIEDPRKQKFTMELDSPPPVRSPKHFMDYDYKFELLGSP